MNFETQAIRTQLDNSLHREHSSPIFATSSYVFHSAEEARAAFANENDLNVYTRYTNPNNDELIDRLKAMEGTDDGMATASGMAAVFASLAGLLKSGDHVLVAQSIFGTTHALFTKILPKWGITSTFVSLDAPERWEAEITPQTRMLFLETPSNPGLGIIDLAWAGDLCRKHGLLFNVDNCFATPYLQNPAQYGADLITHSGTKYLDGQGRVLAGAVLGRQDLIDEIRQFIRYTGPSLSPFNAWVVSKGLETLALRMDRHCESAAKLARALEAHPEVTRVSYPFLPSHPQYAIAKQQMRAGGGLVAFEVTGGLERGRRFLDHLKLCSISPNLGDAKSIATHPASTTHSKLSEEERAAVGITPGFLRISVGLEHYDDILADVAQALEASTLTPAS